MIGISTLNGSYNHPQNGMLKSDMIAAEQVARNLDEVIIFRSTGPWSKRWLEKGYPSKNFHVKGKSSDWGPHAGLVPVNGTYSKVGYDSGKAESGSKANRHGLESGFAIAQDLRLSAAQIHEQVTRAEGGRTAIQVSHLLQGGDRILFASRSGDGKNIAFRAVKVAADLYEIWVFAERQGTNLTKLTFEKPVEKLRVMASAEIGGQKPMTGDYDLMAVCPTWGQYGSRAPSDIVKAGIQLPGRTAAGQSYSHGVGMDNVLDPTLHTMGKPGHYWNTMQKGVQRPMPAADPNRVEHADMGNLTPRILRCINALNNAMGATGANSALRRVHHNAESHRNFAFGALSAQDMVTKKEGDTYGDGFPLTAFQPPSVTAQLRTAGNVLTIENLMHFRMYVNRLDEFGYYVPRNWKWNMTKTGAKYA